MNLNVGADWAFEMPRARRLAEGRAALGRVFLRWRPAYEFRREARIPEGLATRAVERHMLLPLNIGFRWQISARHRFSATLGPRIDLTGYALKVGDDWQRHPAKRAQWGQFHGDAWYEVDFPLSRADIDTPSRWRAAGRLRLGYIHSTFDGQAFNSGAIIGYTGPFYAGWSTRIAKPSVNGRLRAALQIDIGAFIADVPRFHLDVGVALPRPRLRPSPRSRGSRR